MNPRRSRMRGRSLGRQLAAGVVAIAAAGLSSCRHKDAPKAAPAPPLQVSVVTVEPQTVPIVYEFVAQTTASQRVEVRARVQGFLARRAFTEGGQVDEGDLLFRIDPRSFEAELEISQARLAQAQARVPSPTATSSATRKPRRAAPRASASSTTPRPRSSSPRPTSASPRPRSRPGRST